MPTTITACLVVRNEAPVIERCLRSLRDVVDEIVVVHDGECTDDTLNICRQYTQKVFSRPFVGACDAHRPFAFRQAASEWILTIDADEFLSDELRAEMRTLVEGQDVDLYCFLWPYTDGERSLTLHIHHPWAGCLGRRATMYYYGLVHEPLRTYGKTMKVPLEKVHRPQYNNWRIDRFRNKFQPWNRLRAKQVWCDPGQISTFGLREQTALVQHLEKLRSRPLLKLLLCPMIALAFQLYKGMWKVGLTGLKIAVMDAASTASFYWYVYKYRPRAGARSLRENSALSSVEKRG